VDLDLKKEPFFQTIDWENLPNTPAPFTPMPDNDSDTFYFEGKHKNLFNSAIEINQSMFFLARNRAIGFDEDPLEHLSML